MNASSALRVSAGETGPRGPRGDVGPGPVRELADRGRGLTDGPGDRGVAEIEYVVQHEHGPLGRCEGFQHQQHRHRDAVRELDVLGHVGRGQQRLGQPRADVRLLAAAERAQPVQRLAGGDPDQVGALVADRAEVDARPPQPRLLEHVLRVGGRAEQLVGDGEQQVPVGEEGLGSGIFHSGRHTHQTAGRAVL
jgi:hypothetical protein